MSVDSSALDGQIAQPQGRGTPRRMVASAAMIAVCLIAGAWSWLSVKPGDSLLPPMAADVIIFVFFGAVCRLVTALRGTRFGRIGPTSVFLGLGATSLLWTYFGVLPASVGFDSASAIVARHEVAQSAQGCRVVKHGSIGLLPSPYKICTEVIPRASSVEFATTNLKRGYAYVSGTIGDGWFSDECSRHLIGHWWAFASGQYAPVTGCPFGYTFHGGG